MKSKWKMAVAASAITAAFTVVACAPSETTTTTSEAPESDVAQSEQATLGAWGVELDQFDTSVDPGDDFNAYVNGAWLKATEIPGDLARYGMFDQLRLDAEADIRAIVEELSGTNAEAGSLEQKVGDYYASWMNTERLDELGAAPLQPHLDAIFAIEDQDALMKAYANLHNTAPFAIGIIPDPADTTRYIAFVSQSGLGMPDRDYYLKEDEQFANYRIAYKTYMTSIMELAGLDNADTRADAVIALETALAEAHWTQQDSRDIQKIYNPMSPDALAELSPEFNWSLILNDIGLDSVETFVVAQTTAIDSAAEIFADTPLETLKDYLAFHFIDGQAANLSTAFDDASFEFYGKTLRGTTEKRERWKRGVQRVNASLGEAVGQIYLDRHFPPAYKSEMETLVGNLVEAFEERLNANEWMDAETREQALLKLSTFEPRIGYTEKWTDYTPLQINADSLLGNALAVREFQWQEQLDRLDGTGRPKNLAVSAANGERFLQSAP